MVKVPQAPGPPASPVQQIQQAPPQAANLEVDMFSVFQTGVSFITWTVMLLWSNVNFSEFSSLREGGTSFLLAKRPQRRRAKEKRMLSQAMSSPVRQVISHLPIPCLCYLILIWDVINTC